MFKKLIECDTQIAKDFHNLTPEEKLEFYTKHYKLHGENLAMKTLQATKEQRTQRFSEKIIARGKGLDERDLKEKYKDEDDTKSPRKILRLERNRRTTRSHHAQKKQFIQNHMVHI